jgi:Flp pilus assembly pilin Flp
MFPKRNIHFRKRLSIMTRLALKCWREEDGVLSFEWTLVLTLLAIGIVAGLSAARDGIIDELGDTAQAMLALDGSFIIDQPLAMSIDPEGDGGAVPVGGASGSAFADRADYTDCARTNFAGQGTLTDSDS